MAIRIDRPRFRGILGRMNVELEPTEDFVDALEDSINDGREGLATTDSVEVMRAQLVTEIRSLETRLTTRMVWIAAALFTALSIMMALFRFLG